jgi:hypothetical protein
LRRFRCLRLLISFEDTFVLDAEHDVRELQIYMTVISAFAL